VARAATARRQLACCRVGGEGTKVVRQWGGAVAVNGGEACTVVTDDGALALHHGERERGEVGLRMMERGAASGSPSR
jgi:hypothetical protein